MEFDEWLKQAESKELVVSLNGIDSPAMMCYRFGCGAWNVKPRRAVIEISGENGAKLCIPEKSVAAAVRLKLTDGYKLRCGSTELTVVSV